MASSDAHDTKNSNYFKQRVLSTSGGPMIKIGVTGKFCSGKDTFAQCLMSKGYHHISLSDVLREEAKAQGLEVTREQLQRLGSLLREKEGAGVLTKKAIAKMQPGMKYVVTSIRNPEEVRTLMQSNNFTLVALDAPDEVRYKRLVARGRKENEPATFEAFKEAENKELSSTNQNSQQILACMDMAQFMLVNDGELQHFSQQIEENLAKMEQAASFVRPSWDAYFMELIQTIGNRGTCNRGRSGCVLVKNKRILSTGYVGSPPGLPHCDEVGHFFKKVLHDDGRISQHCLRTVHAEANAVAHAAKHGINIDGATIYVKMEPCLDCTKLLISAGIKRVVCEKRYHGAVDSRKMLQEAGVQVEVLNDELEHYTGQT